MTIWISQKLPLFSFERLDMWFAWIGHPCEKLWPFEFLKSFRCSVLSVSICVCLNRTSVWKVMTIWICESFRCLISSVSIYYKPESDIRVKSYDHLNFSRASVVQFLASRHIMRPNRTSVWKVMAIRMCRELPLFNFERLNELCHRIGHPCEQLWPFEFIESFRCSISSV